MRLSEVFSDGPGLAINEFTGKIVRLDGRGGVRVVVRPDTDCRLTLCSLLFDEDAVDGAWTKVDPRCLGLVDDRSRRKRTTESLRLLERIVKAT